MGPSGLKHSCVKAISELLKQNTTEDDWFENVLAYELACVKSDTVLKMTSASTGVWTQRCMSGKYKKN